MTSPAINNNQPTTTSTPLTPITTPEETKNQETVGHTSATSSINAQYPAGTGIATASGVSPSPTPTATKGIENPTMANQLPIVAIETAIKTDEQAIAADVKYSDSKSLLGALDRLPEIVSSRNELATAKANLTNAQLDVDEHQNVEQRLAKDFKAVKQELESLNKKLTIPNLPARTVETVQKQIKAKTEESQNLKAKHGYAIEDLEDAKVKLEEAKKNFDSIKAKLDSTEVNSSSNATLNSMQSLNEAPETEAAAKTSLPVQGNRLDIARAQVSAATIEADDAVAAEASTKKELHQYETQLAAAKKQREETGNSKLDAKISTLENLVSRTEVKHKTLVNEALNSMQDLFVLENEYQAEFEKSLALAQDEFVPTDMPRTKIAGKMPTENAGGIKTVILKAVNRSTDAAVAENDAALENLNKLRSQENVSPEDLKKAELRYENSQRELTKQLGRLAGMGQLESKPLSPEDEAALDELLASNEIDTTSTRLDAAEAEHDAARTEVERLKENIKQLKSDPSANKEEIIATYDQLSIANTRYDKAITEHTNAIRNFYDSGGTRKAMAELEKRFGIPSEIEPEGPLLEPILDNPPDAANMLGGAPAAAASQTLDTEPIAAGNRAAGAAKSEVLVPSKPPESKKLASAEKKLNDATRLIGEMGKNQKLVWNSEEKKFELVDKKPGFAFREGRSEGSIEAVSQLIGTLKGDLLERDTDIVRLNTLVTFLETNRTAQAVLKGNPSLMEDLSKVTNHAKYKENFKPLESLVEQVKLAKDDKLVLVGDKLVMKPRERSLFGLARTGSKPESQAAIGKLIEFVKKEYESMDEVNKGRKEPMLKELMDFINTNEWAQAALEKGNHDLAPLKAAELKANEIKPLSEQEIKNITRQRLETISAFTSTQPKTYTQAVSDARRQAKFFAKSEVRELLNESLRSAKRFGDIRIALAEFNFLDNNNMALQLILPSEKEFRNDFMVSGRWLMSIDNLVDELANIYDANAAPDDRKNVIAFCKEWVSNPDYYQQDLAKIDSLIQHGLTTEDPELQKAWKGVQEIRESQQPKVETPIYKPVLDQPQVKANRAELLSAIKEARKSNASFNELVENTADTILKEDLKAFQQIENYELNGNFELKKGESAAKCPHAIGLNDRFNDMSSSVQDIILSADSHDRLAVIEYFVALASRLVEKGDFHGAFTITSALTSSNITKLSEMKNLERLDKKINEALTKLVSYNKGEGSFKALRQEMAKHTAGYIPPIPVVAKDLFSISETKGNYNKGQGRKDVSMLEVLKKPVTDIEAARRMRVEDLDKPATGLQAKTRDLLFTFAGSDKELQMRSDLIVNGRRNTISH